MSIVRLFAALLFTTLPIFSLAGERTYVFGSESLMDSAGSGFRRAMNAWQDASGTPSTNWTAVEAPPAARVSLGPDVTLMLVEIVHVNGKNAVRLLLLAKSEAPTATIAEGESDLLGPFEVQVVRVTSAANGQTLLLVRRKMEPAYLAGSNSPRSSPRIGGDVGSRILTVRSDVDEELVFADVFMQSMMAGMSAEDASRAAFSAVPPFTARAEDVTPAAYQPEPTRPEYEEAPLNAMVTLRSITGEAAALKEVSSSVAYRSDGRKEPGAVRASGGPDGANVRYGNGRDRVSGSLHALEASGRIDIDSEASTLLNVGGQTRLSISGSSGVFDLVINSAPAGRNALLLDIDLIERNRGASGSSRRQRVRVAYGSTIQISGFSGSRTETRSSSAPGVSGIPYVGGLFGSSSSSSQSLSNALFVTLEMQ